MVRKSSWDKKTYHWTFPKIWALIFKNIPVCPACRQAGDRQG